LIDQTLERPLPQNIEAERAILGAILLNNNALQAAIAKIRSEDFFVSQHRQIFERMIYLASEAKPIDVVTLMDSLQNSGELQSVGGVDYLSGLADGLPEVTNVEFYCDIVKNKSALRTLAYSAEAIKQEALSDESAVAVKDRATAIFSQVDAGTSSWSGMFHSVDEFENAAPLTFAIKNILQNNGATMVGGLSGHGKTLILLSLTNALLRGKGTMLWDYFEVLETAECVIYLVPECAIETFKHRIELFRMMPFVRSERLLVRTLSKGPTPCLSDPRILSAAKGAHVILDTAVRFGGDGDEKSASDNQRGLATDIFSLLGAGARTVTGAHHSPKPFAKETVMTLENVLRGSGDIGAMLSTAWGIKQVNPEQNIIHIENVKPRDFLPPRPFQLVGRPFISDEGDFRMYKRPNECGSLQDEITPARDKGGAPTQAREARAANLALLREWLEQTPDATAPELAKRFRQVGIEVSEITVRKYRTEISRKDRR